jgi:hypothetical protein
VGVVYAFESAINGGNADQNSQLFTANVRVVDGSVYTGVDGATTWLRELAADRTWMDITEMPDVSPSSGQPLEGYWAIASVSVSRQSYRELGVDPMPATLAVIVQGNQIAYLAVRPDLVWARTYQTARVMDLMTRPPLP